VARSTAPDPAAPGETRWGGPPVALAAVLGLAAVLRLVGIRHGLPSPGLVDPGEGGLVRRGWAMSHGDGFDPHRFGMPSGFLDLLGAVEAPFTHPSVLAARIVVVAIAVLAVAATWWLGRIYGLVPAAVAGAVVAVETAHVVHSHAAASALVPATLFVALSLGLAVRGRLVWAAAAAGLATSFAYAAIVLVGPLALVAGRRIRAHLLGAAAFACGFLLASPFVLVHPGAALREAWHSLRGVTHPAFGAEHEHWAGFAYAGHLWHGLGPVLLVSLLGIGVALAQRRERADLLLPATALVLFVALLATAAHPDRRTLLLVPVLAVLAARVRYLASVTLLLLIVPLTWSVRADVALTRTDTRVEALRWVDANVPVGATLAEDALVPRHPRLAVVTLRLPRPGRPRDPNRSLRRLRARGVEYVLVDGAVADRVRAAADRYPRDARFYAALARREPAARFAGEPGRGPWIAIYRIGSGG
jgi:hypothetical protein